MRRMVKITRTRATYKIREDKHALQRGESLFKKVGLDQIHWAFGNEVIIHTWDDKHLEWVRS